MVRYTEAKIREVIGKTLNEVQHEKTCHRRLMKSLKKFYDQCDFEPFVTRFIESLKLVLWIMEKCKTVENALDFAAKFAIHLQPVIEKKDKNDDDDEDEEEEEEELNPFLKRLIEFCLETSSAVDVGVRYRMCYFINLLLTSMSEDAYLTDEMCENIRDAMTERLLDRSPKVRVQAIAAMHRMQEPHNDRCSIIKMYIYHMTKDGSAEVRKAAIQYSAKNHPVLQAVLKRIHDVDESVRRTAYLFLSKITVKSLKIKERQNILKTGLKEDSESVRGVVKNAILPSWLTSFKDDYCQLLYGLDVEFEPELGFRALSTLFERTQSDILFKQLPLDRDAKLIPIDKLQSENISYWRCLIEHLYKKSTTDEIAAEYLDEVIPELTRFCQYIRDFQKMMTDYAAHHNDDGVRDQEHAKEVLTQKMSHKFILLQLFEITKTFDLGDEVGRGNLRQLIEDTLMSDICTIPIIECIVKYYEKIVEDVPSRLTSLAHVISEIRVPIHVAENVVEVMSDEEVNERLIQCQKLKNLLLQKQDDVYLLVEAKKFGEAEAVQQEMNKLQEEIKELSTARPLIEPQTQEEPKNDRETMIKCLTIMFTMAQSSSVKTLTSTLRSLFDNLALPSIDHAEETVQAVALKAVGICLFLNGELAKKHLMMYFLAMTTNEENPELWLTCLRAIFDLLLRYGLEHFDGVINTDITVDNTRETHDGSKRQGTRLYSSSDDTGLSLAGGTGENRQNLIQILLDLIYHLDRDVRTIAVAGFCKLLLHGKLKSNGLLTNLIIRLYDPSTVNDVNLRGTLVHFFKTYPHFTRDGSLSLQQVFIPTLKNLVENPYNTGDIDPYNIAKFIIDLTSSNFHKKGQENYTAHNQIALDILKEMADEDSEIDAKILIKSLKQLVISCDNDEMKNKMREALDNVMVIVNPREKAILKYLESFRSKFELPEAPQEAAEPDENRQSQEYEPMDNDEPDE